MFTRATWNILDNVKKQNEKVQELIGNAFDAVKVMQESVGMQ